MYQLYDRRVVLTAGWNLQKYLIWICCVPLITAKLPVVNRKRFGQAQSG